VCPETVSATVPFGLEMNARPGDSGITAQHARGAYEPSRGAILNDVIRSQTFAAKLSDGKYSKWATRLDAETLESLLWVIGEFGSRFAMMKRSDGTFPSPGFLPHGMSEDRMRNAFGVIATIQSKGRTDWYLASRYDWLPVEATNLDERSL
jgi:hypothetical protein